MMGGQKDHFCKRIPFLWCVGGWDSIDYRIDVVALAILQGIKEEELRQYTIKEKSSSSKSMSKIKTNVINNREKGSEEIKTKLFLEWVLGNF